MPEEEKKETQQKTDEKSQLGSAKKFMFNLCEYIVRQTSNHKNRLRMIEWNVCGDGFMLKWVQYKNGRRDYVLVEYKWDKQTSLNSAKNLKVFYDLFAKKIF